MSYYKTKSIKIKKDGTISVTVASNNVRPLSYFTTEYTGTLADLLEEICTGSFHLNYGKGNEIYRSAADAIQEILWKTMDSNGLDDDTMYRYGLDDRNEARKFLCRRFAQIIKADRLKYMDEFIQQNIFLLNPFIEVGKQHLAEAQAKDEANGVVRIASAAQSIFDGYDLLYPFNSEDGWILAPEKDYAPGVLKTDKKNIIQLGKESEDLYAFLSFTGLNMSQSEYIERYPEKIDLILSKFKRADICVERALNGGAVLRPGIYPYIDHPFQAYAERRIA